MRIFNSIKVLIVFGCCLLAGEILHAQEKDSLDKEETGVQKFFGNYVPNEGFYLVNRKNGAIRLKVITYVRYLNQKLIDPFYVNTLGDTVLVKQRQDVQLNKVNISLKGWVFTPRFNYWVFIWTSNPTMGMGAQVVVGGNVSYTIKPYLTLAGGIMSYNGTRSTEGSYPMWLSVDARLMADEFFRPSYSTSFWAQGKFAKKFDYNVMVGNNMSQLGVDAGQLDNLMNTFSAKLAYYPTTGEYGPLSNFGDFENHEKVATRIAAHYTHSIENRQGQPNTNAFENVTLRLSDGTTIFQPNVFGDSTWVEDARYQMWDVDAGFKVKGFELSGEYFLRTITDVSGLGNDILEDVNLFDHGFQVLASGFIVPKLLQVYAGSSAIFGEHGNPWEFRGGVNIHPFKNHVVRINLNYMYFKQAAVGGLSLPYQLGSNGSIFDFNLVLSF